MLNTAILFALLAFESCRTALAADQASAAPLVSFYFRGPLTAEGVPSDFRQKVPQDGTSYTVAEDMIVYTIIPDDDSCHCTFTAADGSTTVVDGNRVDITGIVYASVTCSPKSSPSSTTATTSTDSASLSATHTPPPPTGTAYSSSSSASTIIPPYPTGSSSAGNRPTASASASIYPSGGSGTRPGGGGGNGGTGPSSPTISPVKGGAARFSATSGFTAVAWAAGALLVVIC